MAAAGFHYVQEEEEGCLRCFECFLETDGWQRVEADPMAFHRYWSSRCRFARGDECGNVPIDSSIAIETNREPITPATYDERTLPQGLLESGGFPDSYCVRMIPEYLAAERRRRLFQELLRVTLTPRPVSPQSPQPLPATPSSIPPSNEESASAENAERAYPRETDDQLTFAELFTEEGMRRAVAMINRQRESRENSPPQGTSPTRPPRTPQNNPPLTDKDRRVVACFQDLRLDPATPSQWEHAPPEDCPAFKQAYAELIARFTTLENLFAKMIQQRIQQHHEKQCCKICLDEEIGTIFLPCGHVLACTTCAKNFKKCPICRKNIYYCLRAFLS